MSLYMENEKLRAAARYLLQKCDAVIKSKIDYSVATLIKPRDELEVRRTEIALRYDLTMIEGAAEELRKALYPASDSVSELRLDAQERVQ